MSAIFKIGLAAALLAGLAGASAARADDFKLNYEAPGVENSTATFSKVGVDTFDTLSAGAYSSISATFGTTGIKGSYSGPNGVQINSADQYGGAGGKGDYAVAFNKNPYTLTLNQQVNYFGYWLSALDPGNIVTFYNNGVEVGQVSPDQVSAVTKLDSAYYGNPNPNFKGQDSGEPYVFINFYDTSGTFNQISFSEAPNFGGGYESDNHTVGIFTQMSSASAAVEAPAPLLGASPIALLVVVGGFIALRRQGANAGHDGAFIAVAA